MDSIVLFDGVCNFCDDAINFIISRDRTARFHFAPLQSETGQDLRSKYRIGDDVDSIVLIEDGRAFTHSTAALRIVRHLGGMWPALYAFVIIPRPIRDFFYQLFARFRYRIFGKKDTCMIPTADVRARFI